MSPDNHWRSRSAGGLRGGIRGAGQGRVRQIVWHLLSNAIKFTPRGGRVAVVTATEGNEAIVKVTDSGPGIDPSFLPRIFDCFTQADASLTRVSGGLGVGLALVKQLVEL